MYNPFALWTEEALNSFVEEGHRYFVRQTFNRGKDAFDENNKGCFLFCHYTDYTNAKEHFDALKNDVHRFLYDWEDEDHKKKLRMAASQPQGYKIYTNTFMPDWEKHITDRIKQKIRTYIQRKGWRPTREQGVQIAFFPHFGEVMIALKFLGREVHVPFDDIEKL